MFKKIALLATSVFFFGCNTDSVDVSEIESGIVPKKIKETIYYDSTMPPDISEVIFNYENGVLLSVKRTDDTYETKYTYNGDKLIKVSNYKDSKLRYEDIISYEGDLITGVYNTNDDWKSEFVYEKGALKRFVYYSRDSQSPTWEVYQTKDIFFHNSNLIKEVENNINKYSPSSYRNEYQYDTKKNPFKNLNPYLKFFFDFETIDVLSINNMLSITSFEDAASTTVSAKKTLEYSYNSKGYPISVKKKNGSKLISQLEIEY
jgi:hypothetical protein